MLLNEIKRMPEIATIGLEPFQHNIYMMNISQACQTWHTVILMAHRILLGLRPSALL